MKILVGCECSGRARDAFLALGHDAWSCDLLPSETPGPHLQGDVLAVLDKGWDMGIFFPPCTYLTISAEWAYGDGPYHQKVKPETLVGAARRAARQNALAFVRKLLGAPIPKIALENPVGVISTYIRKSDQIIQPWMFGEDASKGTCLWLKSLPKLTPTKIIPPKGWKKVKCPGPTQDGIEYAEVCGVMFGRQEGGKGRPVWGNQCANGQNRLGPSPTRATDRGRTYRGVAAAMADQWGAWSIKQ